MPLGIFALYPAGRRLTQKVRVLIDHLVAAFEGPPAWDLGWADDSNSEQVIPSSSV